MGPSLQICNQSGWRAAVAVRPCGALQTLPVAVAPISCSPLLPDSDIFERCYARLPRKLPLKFAAPGAERQDSVFNGFQRIDAAAQVGLRLGGA